MKKILIIIGTFLCTTTLQAQNSLIFNGGIGGGGSKTQVKMINGFVHMNEKSFAQKYMNLTLSTTPYKPWPMFHMNYGFGVTTEIELSEGKAYFFNVSPTLKVVLPIGIYASASQGIGYLTNYNWYLNSHFQFFTHLSGGLHYKGTFLGVFFHHISSGAASSGNIGINVIGIETEFQL